ncbi:tyrosine-type recombinase/integrase [Cryobacterium sp. M91]|uniref:tyrosine-type recombinase/integrase n=1 Tax=Cryobacterium sp. M91 TaxID=2048294 RepID=UPI000CE2BBC0|nr:tyrosine-type recombinase/integrase [Cryobacterium sp. M91]
MSDPEYVLVEGPLVVLVPGFRDRLNAAGYFPGSAAQQLQLIACLSRWMVGRNLAVEGLTTIVVEEFFRERRSTHKNYRTPRSSSAFLLFFKGAGFSYGSGAEATALAWDRTLGLFGSYLADERGLRPTTVDNYLNQARPFLQWHFDRTNDDLSSLTIHEITGFLLNRGATQSRGSIRVAVTALRALSKWLFLNGILPESLAEGIGPATYSAFGSLPKAVTREIVQSLVAQSAIGPVTPYRDRAIVLVLSRLALRCREVAELQLDDLRWRTGTIVVHGKGAALDEMPVPVDVGSAIVDYLERERPASAHRHVFLQARAPHAPLGRSAVGSIINRLSARTGNGVPVGAHQLRHSAATGVLAAGGTLTEAAQLLRHVNPATTVIYARVDLQALAGVARDWPVATASVATAPTGKAPIT